MGTPDNNPMKPITSVERKKERAPARSLLAVTATTLLAAGLFCFSAPMLSVWFLDVSADVRPVANFSRSLRSEIRERNDVRKFERRRLASEEANANVEEDDFVTKTNQQHLPLFETSDIFTVIGPTIFPKPIYMYETEDNHKIEDEIVTYLQPTSGKHRRDRDSVFVFAAEYGFDTYMLFFMTLFESGFKGDVVVGVSKMDWAKPSIREFLEYWKNEAGKNEMTVVVYVVPYHCYNLEGEILDSHRGGMRVCQCHNMFGRKDKETGEVAPLLDKRHGRTAQTIRYELYWIWSEHYDPTSWILLIDARDTIFQESPFRRVPRRKHAKTVGGKTDSGGMLIFFGENADATSLGKSKYNRKWLTLAYGQSVANAFREKPTICSGSTIGEQVAIETYLRAEVAESDESKTVIFGADQGFHNYLYYSNKLANALAISRILVQDQGLGIVNNMGALRDKALSEWGNGKIYEKTDSGITIYNWDGTVSPVVHQYDRHEELSHWWHKRKMMDYQKQWKMMKQKQAISVAKD